MTSKETQISASSFGISKNLAYFCNIFPIDCWVYILKNMEQLNNFPFKDWLQTLDKLEETMRVASLDKDGRERYERSLKQYRDLNALLSYHRDAEQQKLEDGIAIGEAKERAKALKKNLGKARVLITKKGWSLEEAASFLEVSPEDISLS